MTQACAGFEGLATERPHVVQFLIKWCEWLAVRERLQH
jgi:hypothetical protein